MLFRKAITLTCAAGMLAAINAAPASAQTFASFLYNGPATTSYDSATGVFSGVNIPIGFTFNVPNSLDTTSHNARLTFSASRITDFTQATFFGSRFDAQQLVLTSFHITGLDGGNLLSGTDITPATLLGADGSSVASLGGSQNSVGTGIHFQSDYLKFPAVTASETDLSWTLENITPRFSGLTGPGANFNSFQSSITGAFRSPSASVPEPGAMALIGSLCVCGSVLGASRLRRRK